jgi:hypothetical protein
MINAHLTVNIESRDQTDWCEDLAKGLDLLAAYLRENRPEAEEACTDTIQYEASEVNYMLAHLMPPA